MKNKKIIFLVIIVLGIVLIGCGAFVLLNSEEKTAPSVPRDDEESYGKDYQTVNETSDGQVSIMDQTDFIETSKRIGLSDAECNDMNICTAYNKPYDEYDYKDILTISYENDEVFSVGTIMYFTEDDYDADTVVSNLNAVINNCVGYTYTTDYIQNLDNSLQSLLHDDDSENDYATDRISIGEWTLETTIVKFDNLYKVSTYLIKTSDYE